MSTFLNDVVEKILNWENTLENVVCIVPSNRAARTIQKIISEKSAQPVFSPTILNIETFIENLSGLKLASDTEIFLELFSIYRNQAKENAEPYSEFQSWATVLLGDFNEIDRHLLDAEKLYDYLAAIERMEQWGKLNDPTKLIASYLNFSKLTYPLYQKLENSLQQKGLGYQGLLYKKAVENLEEYLSKIEGKTHYFIGLNALNSAEKLIVESLLVQSKSHVLWDLDNYFHSSELYDTAYFIKGHLQSWPKLKSQFTTIDNASFLNKNTLEITGLPKYVLQAKYVAQILKQTDFEKNNVALVLADETLLPLVLNSIPKNVLDVNVTMGYAIANTKVGQLLLQLFKISPLATKVGWHHEDISALFSNPIVNKLLGESKVAALVQKIRTQNIRFITVNQLENELEAEFDIIKPFFQENGSSTELIDASLTILAQIAASTDLRFKRLEQMAGHQLIAIVKELKTKMSRYQSISDTKSIHALLSNVIAKETLSFKGNPDKGLQIMGVLETRALDFDTVIVTSLNEGVLPAGKSNNSFIPFDVKKEFGLPTTKEKDAVYAYHFFRLLQRAKNVHLLYNTEPDVLKGGEKSRFLLQLMADEKLSQVLVHKSGTAAIPKSKSERKSIAKSDSLHSDLTGLANRGLSASSLAEYIKNPYSFYKRYVLGISQPEEVDEQIAYNIFGSIIHDTLEKLYQPLVKKELSENDFLGKKGEVESIVFREFEKYYPKSSILKGRNYIAYHVIVKYIVSVIEFDAQATSKGSLELLSIEEKITLELTDAQGNFLATLKGKLDRMDNLDGIIRVIDYKTGSITPSELSVNNMTLVLSDEKYGKAFQLLFYAYLMYKGKGILPHQVLIMPVKQLGLGLLPFKASKNALLTEELLLNFENGLISLIQEMLDPHTPFKEPESVLF